jgi:hypothetical protein
MLFIFLYSYLLFKLCRAHTDFGARGGAVVEALRYKPEGREFDVVLDGQM